MNFYNDAYARSGFEKPCHEVRQLWLSGKRDEAARAVPDHMVQGTAILGDEAHVRDRLQKYRDVGITELTVLPIGDDATARLDTLGKVVEMAREI